MTSRPSKLVLATGNKGKVAELQGVLAPLQVEVLPQSQFQVSEADETGLTFVENAIIKARHACEATGLPALADDSGLAVDALQGAPGIYSARYAGEQASDSTNIEKLLHALQQVPEQERSAAFHCVLVYMNHANDPTPIIAHGRWQGRIATQVAGDAGFGYDPVFYVPSHGCTAAELTPEVKFDLSHRGQALRKLLLQLQATA
ncbi:non-canonical purine NTP pyrophosphatase, RdgB/HAM1 family [Aliidiomarina taiwanensis]|uniref:dITP/XTP pyrophosphatase n=2 Tax=Aliidiomarina taiwanensis TaxID=946228 RepID=A0A432X004_9GAMM|nr:RdgB/HAM1 family non-canonical purine NTP pyrophosphatase [Aliidiomarina taiwanensis]RUO39401.1 non-canonical purine NTP pyrophosphatase, RdgB/HAM1 family [Aliidiomarina taiwanensis]